MYLKERTVDQIWDAIDRVYMIRAYLQRRERADRAAAKSVMARLRTKLGGAPGEQVSVSASVGIVRTNHADVVYMELHEWDERCKHCSDAPGVHAEPAARCLTGVTTYHAEAWHALHSHDVAVGDRAAAHLRREDARVCAIRGSRALLQELGARVTPPPRDVEAEAVYDVGLETSHGLVQASGQWSPTNKRWQLRITDKENS